MDAFGNLSVVNEPDPATGSSSTGPVTNYTYNGANQLTNVSMTRPARHPKPHLRLQRQRPHQRDHS